MRHVRTAYSIRYRQAESSDERQITINEQGVAQPAQYAHELGISVVRREGFDHTSWSVTAEPAEDVAVISIAVTVLGLNVRGAEKIYLNGYNSWTDSVEHHPLAGIRGLHGVPKALVNKWILDRSGDYRFVEQSGLPGGQHGMGYGYLRRGNHVILVGSLNEDSGFTVVRESAHTNNLKLEKEPPNRVIAAGETVELFSYAMCVGTLDEAFARYIKLCGITRRPAAPLVGFSSWYRHYDQIDDGKLASDLEGVKAVFADRDLGPCKAVFQIDDGYATVGDWMAPHHNRFPEGIAHFAQEAHEAGLMPGLWMAPFVCSVDSAVYRDHQDWILRDEQGELVMTGDHWHGAYALDTLNPEVRDYLATALRVVTEDWGFKLLKLDFLYGACMLPHNNMNRGQLMADALDLLRASVSDDVVFDFCGVPLVSAFGRCEYCRIGPDVGLDWDDVPYMRLLHRERVSTRRSLANTLGRAHLDGVVFRNDPDVFFLRDDVKITSAQKMMLLEADSRMAGMLLTSDDVAAWDIPQRAIFEHALTAFIKKEEKR